MKRDNLYDIGNGQQIRVALRWIYSKVKLLEDIQKQLRYQIETESEKKEASELLLKKLEQPFGSLINI